MNCIAKLSFRSGLVVAFIIASLPGSAQDHTSAKDHFNISLSTGYQVEYFQWSIAGNLQGKNPNIYSELIWKNLQGPSLKVEGEWKVWKKLIVLARYSQSFIISGSASDTDYQSDNRTNPSFNISVNSSKGSTHTLSTGLGIKIIENKKWSITPYLGYGLHRQSYYLNEEDLNSTYKTSWSGPLIAINSKLITTKKSALEFTFTYNQTNYEAEADWNLVEEFKHPVSFRHVAKGYGLETEIKLCIKFSHSLTSFLTGNYFYWDTGSGIDKLFLESGEVLKTKFNDATRNGVNARLGVNFTL